MDKSYVTLEQKMCPICGTTHDSGALLLDRRMKPTFEKHTTTGYGLCKDCQQKKDDGYVALIVCDPTKSTIVGGKVQKMEDAHRTGEIIHVRKAAARRIFTIDIGDREFVFIGLEAAEKVKQIAEGAQRKTP